MACSSLSWLLPLAQRSIRQCSSCTPFISVPTVVALDTTAVVTTTTCRHTSDTSTHFIAPSASRCTLRLCMVLCHISLDHDVVSCWCRCVATAVRAKICAAAVFGSASSPFDTLSSALFALQCTARFLDLLCCSLFAALHAPNPCLQPSSCSVLPAKFLRSTQPLGVIVPSPLLQLSALPCSPHFHAAYAGNTALASYCLSYTTQCRCLVVKTW